MAKHPGGRPTKLTAEIKKQAVKYLEDSKDTIEHFEGDSGKHWETIRVKLPTIEGLARVLKVNRATLYNWAEKDQEFLDILDDIKSEQADRLINRGLAGEYNPTMAKLMLTKHGYSDKTETDITSGGQALPVLVEFVTKDETKDTDTN